MRDDVEVEAEVEVPGELDATGDVVLLHAAMKSSAIQSHRIAA